MKDLKRVAVYIRVSTTYESQENSIKNQKSYFETMISNETNYQLEDYYVDDGKSGKSFERRLELQRLLDNCENGKIDLILVKSISRFARNTIDLLNMVDKLSALGVEIRFDQENISTFDSGGRFILTVLASLAEQEANSISDNIKWSVQKLHDQNMTSSHIRALGYGWDSLSKNCYVIEDEAQIVRCIFTWRRLGLSIQEIVEKLNARNLRGIRGARYTWQSVNRILNNPLYMGKLKIGDKIVKGRHEPIILEDDFFCSYNKEYDISKILNKKRALPKLYCGYCNSHLRRLGGHYRSKGRENVHVYRCICCKEKVSIPEDEFELINIKLYGINFLEIVNDMVRKYVIYKDTISVFSVGSNKCHFVERESRFRRKKVYR